MTTIRTSLIASLALTFVLTVGAEISHAQKGRFGGLMKNRSSNSGGNNGSRFSLGNSSGLGGSNHNNSLQNFSQKFSTQQKTFGQSQFNGIQSQSNSRLGINRSNLTQIGRGNGSTLQNVLGNGKAGTTILGASKNKQGGIGNHFNSQKFDGLKNVLQGKHGKTAGLQILGNGHNSQGHGGHGHGGKLMHLIQHNQKHGKVCLGHKDWCHAKPKTCHWWYDYCKPLAYCEPQHHHYCTWNYVTCDYLVNGHVVHADARWSLGLKGLLLPGQGVGVEEVAPGSPAAAVGLQPGMVITRCNGIDMVDEAALAQAIGQSGGVLQMDLLLAEGTPATCVVVMQRVTSVNF